MSEKPTYEDLLKEIERLEDSERAHRTIVENSPDLLYRTDLEGRIIYISRSVYDLSGYTMDEAIGMKMAEEVYLVPEERDEFLSMLQQNGKVKNFEARLKRKDGSVWWASTNAHFYKDKGGNIIGVEGITRDITERRKMESLMIHSEKMVSLGGLAAGMAHEINNPLAGMLQNAQMALSRISPDNPANRKAAREAGITFEALHDYLEKRGVVIALNHISTSGLRAAKIVKNMLSFARKSSSVKRHEDLAEIIEKALELTWSDWDLKHTYDVKRVKIVHNYAPDMPNVLCEKSKIQQVFFNIIKNAAEAMSLSDKAGRDSKLIFHLSKWHDMALVEIEDNGPGMDLEIQKRLFEPFYTTKSVDQGTGLGLSVSYFIVVNDHKGKMEVESLPGIGSKFKIFLPI